MKKTKKQQYNALKFASLKQRWKLFPDKFIYEVVVNSEVDERMLNKLKKDYVNR